MLMQGELQALSRCKRLARRPPPAAAPLPARGPSTWSLLCLLRSDPRFVALAESRRAASRVHTGGRRISKLAELDVHAFAEGGSERVFPKDSCGKFFVMIDVSRVRVIEQGKPFVCRFGGGS